MLIPHLQDDALLADIRRVRALHGPSDALHAWWLGQSGFLLHYKASFLLLDPYLSDSLTRKYAHTDKPHVRMTARVVDPSRLDFLSAVTSSHVHTDHLDPETLRPLVHANPNLVLLCPEAIRTTARERASLPDERILGFDHPGTPEPPGTWLNLPGSPFSAAAVPAAHETLERDRNGHLICLGFLIRAGPWLLYHSGDTLRYDGMEAILGGQPPDLAMLPINGRGPERRVAGNLWGREAAQLAKDIGARCVVPCHFDMFEFNTASPDEFVAECRRQNQPFQVLQQGQSVELMTQLQGA